MSEEQIATLLKRPSVSSIDDCLGQVIPVQNNGHVRVIDYMGDEAAVVQAARVSYGQGTKSVNEDRGLIRYLLRHNHTTPFEMCVLKLHLKMPIFVARQWVRHRMSSMNEYSARYSEMRDEFFIPEAADVLGQSTANKQGSDGQLPFEVVSGFQDDTEDTGLGQYSVYKAHLESGVSRELARINLPLSTYTEFYWKIDLHNLLRFLKLRCDPHAQKQIRDYADVLAGIVDLWVPNIFEAYEDYIKNARTFSAQELDILKQICNVENIQGNEIFSKLSKREQAEFLAAIGA